MGILKFHIDSLECVNEGIREPTVNKAVDFSCPVSNDDATPLFKATCIGKSSHAVLILFYLKGLSSNTLTNVIKLNTFMWKLIGYESDTCI